jgi:hypothetical protein
VVLDQSLLQTCRRKRTIEMRHKELYNSLDDIIDFQKNITKYSGGLKLSRIAKACGLSYLTFHRKCKTASLTAKEVIEAVKIIERVN